MKPALSPIVTSILPSRAASASTSSTTEGSVTTMRTTSTSFITGAGLKKCIPMTLPGRPVVTDSSVTDRLEVLVARMVSGGQTLSSAEKTSALSSIRSGIASTTSSATARSSMLVENRIRDRISSRSAASSLPGATALPVDCSTCARPRCSAPSVTSTAVTDSPARASTSAMRAPIVPSPSTPTSVSSLATVPPLLPSGDRRTVSHPRGRPALSGYRPVGTAPRAGHGVLSEQPGRGVVGALEDGVVDGDAVDPPVLRQHPGLRLDLLRGEHALDRRQERIAVEQLQVAGELLDAVDLAAPLDLHGHRGAPGVPAEQVDRADRGRVLAADQRPSLAEGLHVQGEQPLQLCLDAVLLQPRVDAELVPVVVLDRLDGDDQLLTGLVGDRPGAGCAAVRRVDQLLLERARRAHPVQRLVGAVVGVDRHRAVGLDQQQPGGEREMGGEP